MRLSLRYTGLLLAQLLLTQVQASSLVQFRTVLGDVEVELLDTEKPLTVANFKRYVEAGVYRESFFHRAVHNFIIQGGAYTIADRAGTTVAAIPVFAPISSEFRVGPFRSNTAGTIAMAKTSDPNSATSQFFFNLTDNSRSLDNPANSGGFTVFGIVRGDTNILAKLNSFVGRNPPTGTNLIINAGGVFAELPVLAVKTNAQGRLSSDSFVFVDVSLLAVHIERSSGGGRSISWDSSRGGTNHVEFTTTFPPVWQNLTNLVRPASPRSSVTDPEGSDARFYRVRVSY